MARFEQSRSRIPLWPLVAVPVAFAIAFAIGLFGAVAWMLLVKAVLALGGHKSTASSPGVVTGGTLLQDIGFVLGPLLALQLRGLKPTAAEFGFVVPARIVRIALASVGGWLAYIAIAAGWSKLVSTHEHQSIVKDLGVNRSATMWAVGAFLITVAAPLCEEFLFRGFLFPLLWRRWGLVAGVLVSSVVFGLLHGAGTPFALIVPLIILAVVLALLRAWTGSVIPGIGVHAFNNAIAFGVLEKIAHASLVALIVSGVGASLTIAVIIARRA